ncbi:hypothetical protein FSP39_019601 [Pinctada imbricata]|uniref:Uncharacterized protein n=1 Tax=Pinctada imbricata TaxID=66713 RepID=A0AA88YEL2_PINIB|nr:hypothetical protein FSP39_019601 [Pinctada imbricata]
MGQQTSSIARKVSRSVSSLFGVTSNNETTSISTAHLAVTPFVFKRQGSMYFDEDGDLAHAFYIEKNSNGCAKMVQTWDNLYPQGEVDLPHPRLNVDFPIILCEAPLS